MQNKNQANQITIFAMSEKGYGVLKRVLPEFRDIIKAVVSSRDSQVMQDFYLEIKEICQQNDINFVDKKDFEAIVTQYALAISWRWMIPRNNSRLIVIHDSLLPKYRGFNPLVSALINGEVIIGVTAIFATSEYDKGDIITQSSTQISYPITIQEAINKIIKNYEEVVLHILDIISNNKEFNAVPQVEAEATYSLWRDEDDYLINWNQTATQIKRFIDAVGFPYKGAATRLDAELVRVLEAEIVKDVVIENRVPGKVIFMEDGLPIVVCGEGLIKIKKLIDSKENDLLPLKKFRVKFR